MNYCPRCKLRMPAEATVCNKCGGALRMVGAAATGEAGAASPAESALSLQLQGLRHEVQRSRKALLLFGTMAMAAMALLVALLVGLRVQHVLQYAEVAEIRVRPVEGNPGEADIRFIRRSSGKVEFIREASGRTETLIDHGRQGDDSAEQHFTWSGSDSREFTIRARIRDGWTTAERVWTARDGKVESQP